MAVRKLDLPLWLGHRALVWGGPYMEIPPNMVGVKMAEEIPFPCDINIPTPDFQVPPLDKLDDGLIEAVNAIVKGHPIYVGCMGGRGRTGLFLAILAKAWGIDQPVEYVREHYYEHAVETTEQYQFVMDYQVPEAVKSMVFRAKFGSLFNLRRRNITRVPSTFDPRFRRASGSFTSFRG